MLTTPSPPSPPSTIATQRIWSILSYFETGKVTGDYSALAVLSDKAGFSYGKHQSTDRAGSLDRILIRYIDLGAAGDDLDSLVQLLPHFAGNETTLLAPATTALERLKWPDWAQIAADVLIRLGTDPLMREAQDEVFAEDYWEPSLREGTRAGVQSDLAQCMLYDTAIQSGPSAISKMRNLFPEASPARGGDEKIWTYAYLSARRAWLIRLGGIAARTTYRVDALKILADQGVWSFAKPFELSTASGRKLAIP